VLTASHSKSCHAGWLRRETRGNSKRGKGPNQKPVLSKKTGEKKRPRKVLERGIFMRETKGGVAEEGAKRNTISTF